MRALFITTETVDCLNHVQAWNSISDEPAAHITYDHYGIDNGWRFVEGARRVEPKVIFYIGACKAKGNPKPGILRDLRTFAPTVLLCSDAADAPWHPVLAGYRTKDCFDLLVSIDGAIDAPVDLATLTPVNASAFSGSVGRYIRCGFSGTVGRWNARSETLRALEWVCGVTIRDRVEVDSYKDHVDFMKRCHMVINISNTGSGQRHHIKGRVLEAGFAGCALMEDIDSPIGKWLPEDCYISYRDAKHAAELIKGLDDSTIERSASRMSEEVHARYTPEIIYGNILERLQAC